jgi:hypothetical protein
MCRKMMDFFISNEKRSSNPINLRGMISIATMSFSLHELLSLRYVGL